MIDQLMGAAMMAAADEYNRACDEHGKLFASIHEGHAVLREEVDETIFETNKIAHGIEILWNTTKKENKAYAIRVADMMQENAIKAACEALQVAAMCQKFRATVEASMPPVVPPNPEDGQEGDRS